MVDEYISEIAYTMGDPSGIGPEILLALLEKPWGWQPVRIRVFGSSRVLASCAAKLFPSLSVKDDVILGGSIPCKIESVEDISVDWTPGVPVVGGASMAWKAIDRAIDAVSSGECRALVTGPIHKAEMMAVGFPTPGHTEYLGLKTGVEKPVMLYDSPRLRVALATTHIALKDVPKALTSQWLVVVGRLVTQYVRKLGIETPRLAMAGLNPHAGSGDVFGPEEDTILIPAVSELRKESIDIAGPIAADTVFHRAVMGEFDAVVSLYHDQGSIPVKTLDFQKTVNVTLGLPFVRTSVDHGTAYDIAGTGQASSTNLETAVKLAIKLTNSR